MKHRMLPSISKELVLSFIVLLGLYIVPVNTSLFGQATISVSNPSITEGNSGITNVTFTVTCDPCAVVNALVDWCINDGSATSADSDYNDLSGTIDDLGNGTSVETVNITVQINGDTKVEADETFELELHNASVGPPSLVFRNNDRTGIATIINDDEEGEPPAQIDYGWLVVILILLILIFCLIQRVRKKSNP